MKNYFLMAGATVLLVTGCAMEKVTEVSGNREITFEQFVNNGTKAVTELTSVTNFYVFGKAGDEDVYSNERNDVVKYWEKNKTYNFAAYADGENGKLSEVTYDSASKTINFTSYKPDDKKDLIAAVAQEVTTGEDVSIQSPVSLTFKHLLSQVKFTFTTPVVSDYTIKISEIKVNAINTSDCNYSESGAVWSVGTKGDYVFSEIADIADEDQTAACESKLVIPQGGTDAIKVTFSATMSGAGINEKTKAFEATLAIPAEANPNTWMPGYRYNYTAEITAESIDSELKKIEFTPTVEEWKNADDSETNPATPAIP